jgi:hypothetical protein
LAQSGHGRCTEECPLSGVEWTKSGGKLRLRLRRSGFLKIVRPEQIAKNALG